MFDRKGLLSIPADQIEEEALMDLALEAGADDVRREGDNFEVTCDPNVYSSGLRCGGRRRAEDRSPANHAHSQGYRRPRPRGGRRAF